MPNVKKDVSYVDAIKGIEYSDRREFGFIQGYRGIRIFFHISDLKRAHFPNFEQLLELLEKEEYTSFPIIWFVVKENEKGLYVSEFLSKSKFINTYRNNFIAEYGNSLKNDVIDGKDIDSRINQLLYELYDVDDYYKIIQFRYDYNNSQVTKWELGFLTPYQDEENQEQIKLCTLGFFEPKIDFDISEFIKNKILDLITENQVTPIFYKLGKNIFGFSIVTDVQRYDPLSMNENSEVIKVKSFIEHYFTSPVFSTNICDFWLDCYNVLFTENEKEAIQSKKEKLLQEYLEKLEQTRIAREQAEEEERKRCEEQARIAREEEIKREEEQRRKNEQQEADYNALLAEVRPLGFTKSSQVSNYIIENNLKIKYGSIAGVAMMRKGLDTWRFDGGISPKYYKRLCTDLNLENNNSGSIVIDYLPYKTI